jgi:prolyl 4-hydroxylase
LADGHVVKRARGNLKYFEFQMLQQRSDEEEAAQKQRNEGTVGNKTEEKKKGFKEPIPERKMYEKLCRGEGIQMVRSPLPDTHLTPMLAPPSTCS